MEPFPAGASRFLGQLPASGVQGAFTGIHDSRGKLGEDFADGGAELPYDGHRSIFGDGQDTHSVANSNKFANLATVGVGENGTVHLEIGP